MPEEKRMKRSTLTGALGWGKMLVTVEGQ